SSVKVPADPSRSYTFMVRRDAGSGEGKSGRNKKEATGQGTERKEAGIDGGPKAQAKEHESRSGKGEQPGGKKQGKEAGKGGAAAGGPGGQRGVAYYVNPYTGEILGNAQ